MAEIHPNFHRRMFQAKKQQCNISDDTDTIFLNKILENCVLKCEKQWEQGWLHEYIKKEETKEGML